MKYIVAVICIPVMVLFSSPADSLDNSGKNSISYRKLSISMTGVLLTTAASYYVVKNTWWSSESTGFHFDSGKDLEYAKNLDKFSHFYGGYIIQDIYYRSLKWSGVNKSHSLLYSTGISIFTQVMIDVKDGYSPYWGFSIYDVLSGSAGAVYGCMEKKYPFLSEYRFKLSYYSRKDDYGFEHEWYIEDVIEDYPNQTYWLVFPVKKVVPGIFSYRLPEYLDIAFGMSVDDKIGWNTGDIELYLSLDIDIEEAVRPLNNKIVSSVAHYLNYLKFPAPALKISPVTKGYLLYY